MCNGPSNVAPPKAASARRAVEDDRANNAPAGLLRLDLEAAPPCLIPANLDLDAIGRAGARVELLCRAGSDPAKGEPDPGTRKGVPVLTDPMVEQALRAPFHGQKVPSAEQDLRAGAALRRPKLHPSIRPK